MSLHCASTSESLNLTTQLGEYLATSNTIIPVQHQTLSITNSQLNTNDSISFDLSMQFQQCFGQCNSQKAPQEASQYLSPPPDTPTPGTGCIQFVPQDFNSTFPSLQGSSLLCQVEQATQLSNANQLLLFLQDQSSSLLALNMDHNLWRAIINVPKSSKIWC